MNEQLLQSKALEEAVFSIVSYNEKDFSAEEIFKAWKEGQDPEGVIICEDYEHYSYDPYYLSGVCENLQRQFARFAREILEGVSK